MRHAHRNQEGSKTLLVHHVHVLMCIENRADHPRPWTEVLTTQVVPIERTGHFMFTSIDATKTLEPAPMIWPQPARKKKPEG